jgi:hypothetical protein
MQVRLVYMSNRDILAARIAQQHDHLKSLLGLYMTWYTFFWTINVAALAWIVASDKGPPSENIRLYGGCFFAFMNVLATITSLWMIRVVGQMSEDIVQATNILRHGTTQVLTSGDGTNPLQDRIDTFLETRPYPKRFLAYGLCANGSTLFVLTGIWVWLAFCKIQPTQQKASSGDVTNPLHIVIRTNK